MLDVDLERFWADDSLAQPDPFGLEIPQPVMGISLGYQAIFDELGLELDMQRVEKDYAFARSAGRAYNDLSEKIIGKRVLDEAAYDPARRFPAIKSLGEIFGCRVTRDKWSTWLLEAAHTPQELAALLDRVEKLDLRRAMFPDNWESECRRLNEQCGLKPHPGRCLRGPVTLATSIYGSENLIYLILDDQLLATRFRDVLLAKVLEYYTILYQVCATKDNPSQGEPGFAFFDDNCALMTPEMYVFFGQPILKAVFARFAPGPEDYRYQHSDSDMGHLLPLLAETGLNRVNFGPNIRFKDIRAAMPRAVVEGTMAPFTLMRNNEAQIIAEVRRDCDEAHATRGLVVATAGSVNDGTRLTSVRAIMHTIQKYGRYN